MHKDTGAGMGVAWIPVLGCWCVCGAGGEGLARPWQVTVSRTSGQRIAPIPTPFHPCSRGLWSGVRAEEKQKGQVLVCPSARQ